MPQWGYSMAPSVRQDRLLDAFRTIRVAGSTIPPHCLAKLGDALRQTADDLRLAGRPVELVVAQVKLMATEAGVREWQDRLFHDAVLWAITYYGETMLDPIPSSPRYRHRSSERTVPLDVAIESLSRVTEESDVRGPESLSDAKNSPDNRKRSAALVKGAALERGSCASITDL
jgi:hypothetical protein